MQRSELFDHLIGSHQRCSRNYQVECFQSLLVNREMEAGRLRRRGCGARERHGPGVPKVS